MRRILRTRIALALGVAGFGIAAVYWVPRVPLPAAVVWGDAIVVPADGCLYRVSRTGNIHRAGSDWWFVTSRERCFDSRAEAQRYARSLP